MSTDIGGRAVLRPAGNVARANLRKASKPPPSPVKPPLKPPSSKISPPNSLPSSPKTLARTPPLKPNSPSKFSPHNRPPTPSPVSLLICDQAPEPVTPLDLANDGAKPALTSEGSSAAEASDVSGYGSNTSIWEDEFSGCKSSLFESDASSNGSDPFQSGPSVGGDASSGSKSSGGSKSAGKGAKPFLNRSTSLSGLGKQPRSMLKSSPDALHASVSSTQRTPNPGIVLTKSTSEVFQRSRTTSNLKANSSSKKNLSRLGSLSFDESSLATMVAAKKAAAKEISAQRKQKVSEYGRKLGKASRVAPEVTAPSLLLPPEPQRCKFITAQTDPIYVEYHDKEWGVPVHDDRMLFELLSLAGFQSELSWTTILHKRDTYRAIFAEFDPAAVALFGEKHIVSLEADRSLGLPTGKVRGVVNNAQRILEVVHEAGSFDEFLWAFVNKQPMVNNYRYPKQVPAKTSKAEFISKDLVKRGFRFVCPTIIYSFMQASGITNDHLVQCFRHRDCMGQSCSPKAFVEDKLEGITSLEGGVNQMCPLSFVLEEGGVAEGLAHKEDFDFEQQEGGMNCLEQEQQSNEPNLAM